MPASAPVWLMQASDPGRTAAAARRESGHRPRVSVILPGRDVADFLGDALTSLTRQLPAGQLEVIMVNDGSVDDTGTVAEAFRSRLPGLRVLHNIEPIGLASARNLGLQAATGTYLVYLDGDDWLVPGHLASLADAMDALAVDFVRTDHVTVLGRARRLRRPPQGRRNTRLDPRGSILPAHDATMVDYPYAWAGMFHRRLAERGLLDFPDGLQTAEDRPWIWRLHLQAESYAVVDSPGICYRRGRTASLTQIADSRQLDVLTAFDQARRLVAADHEADRFMPKLIRMTLAIIAHHLGRDHLMHRADRNALHAGARSLIASLPHDQLTVQLGNLSISRLSRLRRVLEVRDRWAA